MSAGQIPRNVEVLLKKAAVDPEFRALLLDKRAEAAKTIGLELAPEEIALLADCPREMLETIIATTYVEPKHRSLFLSTAGILMLAALGVVMVGGLCLSAGARAHRPVREEEMDLAAPGTTTTTLPGSDQTTRGSRPDVPPLSAGERPDIPVPEQPR